MRIGFVAGLWPNECSLPVSAGIRSMQVLVVFLGAVLSIASASVSAATVPGAIPGSFGVSEAGAATYSIPIAVPPGTAGMEPKLSLNYSSQTGNGVAGVGWSIGGLSAITRCPQTIVQDGQTRGVQLDANDRFCLDGQRLIIVTPSTTYGAVGAEYRTEIESFSKVVSYGGVPGDPQYFKVWTKAGQVIEFGNDDSTSHARVEAQGKAIAAAWAVNKISDTVGNYIAFTYFEDNANGEHHITRINYTGNATANVDPYNAVEFQYETRPDITSGWVKASKYQTSQRLSKISTFNGANVVKDYNLAYEMGVTTGKSRLVSITGCVANGDCLNPTSFVWQEAEMGLDVAVSTGVPSTDYQYTHAIDVNGDGVSDMVYPTGGTWKVRFGGQTGLGDEVDTTIANTGYEYARPTDYNVDGRADLLVPYANGRWYLLRATGDQQTPFGVPLDTGITDAGKASYPQILDMNGDGIPDLAQVVSGKWHYVLGTASGFSGTLINTNFNPGYADYGRVGELDGDGLGDLFMPSYERSYVDLYAPPTTRTSWTANDWHVLDTRTTGDITELADIDTTRPEIIPEMHYDQLGLAWWTIRKNGHVNDFSGDGLSDLFTIQSRYAGSTGGYYYNASTQSGNLYSPVWYVCINKGGAFDPPAGGAGCAVFSAWNSKQILLPIDLNADGIGDHILSDYQNNWTFTFLSSGDSSSASKAFVTGSGIFTNIEPGYDSNPLVGDFNGDGLQDLMLAFGGVWNHRPHKGLVPDRVITITDGLGAARGITYKPLTDPSVYIKGSGSTYPVQDVQNATYVVSETAADDGIGGQFRIAYRYAGARSHLTGRGFLGFATLEQTDLQTGIITRTDYRQDFPYIGLPTLVTKTSSGGVELKRVENTYAEKTIVGAGRFPYLAYSKTQGRDLNGAILPASETWNTTYDDWGNLTQTITQTVGSDTDILRKQTDNTYTNDTANWFLGRLTRASVTNNLTDAYFEWPAQTRVSAFEYDPSTGLLTKEIIEPDKTQLRLETVYAHDPFGNRKTMTVSSPATGTAAIVTRSSGTTYDTRGQFPETASNAVGHAEQKTFDARFGTVATLTGPNNLTTTWQYDGFGRKKTETRADGTQTIWTYDVCDAACPAIGAYRVVTQVFASGGIQAAPVSVAYFDRFNRQVRSAAQAYDGRWVYNDTQYDSRGRVAQTSRPYYAGGAVYWITSNYDDLGRVTQVFEPDAPTTAALTVVYNGLTVSRTNRKNQATVETTNSAGQRISVTDAAMQTTRYTYDPFGNLRSTIDPAGNQIVNLYDIRGRKSQTTDPDLGLWKYEYDALGELVKQTDAKLQVTTFKYDVLGRTTQRVEPGLTSNWVWDTAAYGKGKLKVASSSGDGGYSRTYTYDTLGRPSRIRTWDFDGGGHIFEEATTYDAAGRIDTTEYPSGLIVKNVYNALGYLAEVRNATTTALYWQLNLQDAEGRVTQETIGNGVVTQREYQPDNGRLLGIYANTAGGAPVQQLQYLYDTLGNVRLRNDDLNQIYDNNLYDKLNRLTQTTATIGGVQAITSVVYDALGNLTSKTGVGIYTYGDTRHKHAVTQAGGNAYGYDANGNLESGGGRTVTWTAWNMPLSITESGQTTSWNYGPEHDRYKMVTNGRTTWYLNPGLYQGGHYERTEYASGTIEHRHTIYGGDQPIGEVLTFDDASPAQTRYFHSDHQGSITAVTDSAGAVITRYRYDPWGKQTLIAGSNTGIAQTRQGHTGHEMLDGGLTHMNGRLYDPVLSRFISADPIVQEPYDLQNLNRYSYVLNNPLFYTDPSGYDYFYSPDSDFGFAISTGTERMAAILSSSYGTAYGSASRGGSSLGSSFNFSTGGAGIGQSSIGSPRNYGGNAGLGSGGRGLYPTSAQSMWSGPSGMRHPGAAQSSLSKIGDDKFDDGANTDAYERLYTPADPRYSDALNATPIPGFEQEMGGGELATLLLGIVTPGGQARVAGALAGRAAAKGAPSLDALSHAAGAADRNGLTRAGRSLQKHGSRPGSRWNQTDVDVNVPSAANSCAQDLVDDGLTTPGSRVVPNPRGGWDAVAPDGRIVRYNRDGSFQGLRE